MALSNIDAIDRKILAVLRRDGRITNARLAEEVGLSPSACLMRHKRLEREGIITGYRAELSLDQLRPTMRVLLEITLSRHSPEDFRVLETALCADPRVTEAGEVSGRIDYYASLCLHDTTELRDFIDTLTVKAPVIESVNSHVVLHLAKRSGAPPLE
ncbi:Lrp/AsnC family transcriptional regulator [Novosphingobium aerophilum]|uniref:Lrp/AsnC family transcriptional regulator n=1 Tax=Novosphingobium aerophilum TaxID=2839843 RepID=A0A7X1F4F8_9SPHN|nr:Lrp/AsnC family transcriptional regulator [Novosphingobium aerophilum]MBC2650221.1 Lrp/AsnC family transcriptional regulator [Novosphingobium aerophilum]